MVSFARDYFIIVIHNDVILQIDIFYGKALVASDSVAPAV